MAYTTYGDLRDITEDALGNVYTCGVNTNGGLLKNQITKWDINGNLQWNNYFNSLNTGVGCSDIFIACNNQIIVTGKVSLAIASPQNFDPLGGVYEVSTMLFSPTNTHNFIASYNPLNGGILWAKCVGGDGNVTGLYGAGGTSYINNSGSVYLSSSTMGLSNDFDPGSGVISVNLPTTANVFFAKYTGCGAVGIEENNDANTISVSPNPSNDKFIFSNLIGDNKIEVIDITGRLILTDEIKYTSYTLSMDDLPKGMYFYKITDAKGQLKQGKLLLQ